MSQNPDQLSRLLLEADGLLLLLHRHRDETPIDAIRLLRKKLELIIALTDGFDESDSDDQYDNNEIASSADIDINESSTDTNALDNHSEPAIVNNDEPVFIDSDTPVFFDDNCNNDDDNDEHQMTDVAVIEPPLLEPGHISAEQAETTIHTNTSTDKEVNTDEDEILIDYDDDTIPVYRHTYIVDDNDDYQLDNIKSREAFPLRKSVSSVFNLNDKFRFRRELFGNSDAQYVECLNLLSAMDSLDEAKEYLFDDLSWDPNNEDVKAFIELISNYYNA